MSLSWGAEVPLIMTLVDTTVFTSFCARGERNTYTGNMIQSELCDDKRAIIGYLEAFGFIHCPEIRELVGAGRVTRSIRRLLPLSYTATT